MTYLCKKWAQCLPMWGKVLAPDGQNCFPKVAQYRHIFPWSYLQSSANISKFLTSAKTPFIFATKMAANKKSHPCALILPFFHTFASIDTAQTVCVAR